MELHSYRNETSGVPDSSPEVRVASSANCRILIAGSRTNKADGRYSRALAEKLSNRGHRVVLLLPGPRTSQCDDLLCNPSTVVWPSKRPTHLRDAVFLIRLMVKIRPTHVIGNFGSVNMMMIIGCALNVPNRISWYRTLSTAMELDNNALPWKRQLQRFRKRLVYLTATDIMTNSAAGKRDVVKVYRVPSRKITVFANCIADPLPAVSEQTTHLDRDRIVCAGRLDRVKGQDVLLYALSLVHKTHPNANVVFVGDGPLEAEYRSLAARLGIAHHCEFVGGQPNTEVLRQLATAMVSVVPSRSEAFGYVNIESMAVGTPVVASRVGGISEIIRDGVDGFLIPPNDVDALANRLTRLLSDVTLRSKLGRNARHRFVEHYDQEAILAAQSTWLEAMMPQTHDGSVRSVK